MQDVPTIDARYTVYPIFQFWPGLYAIRDSGRIIGLSTRRDAAEVMVIAANRARVPSLPEGVRDIIDRNLVHAMDRIHEGKRAGGLFELAGTLEAVWARCIALQEQLTKCRAQTDEFSGHEKT